MKTSYPRTFATGRKFRIRLRFAGWLVFWASCVATPFLRDSTGALMLDLLAAGSLVLALTHLVAWLMRLSSHAAPGGHALLRWSYRMSPRPRSPR